MTRHRFLGGHRVIFRTLLILGCSNLWLWNLSSGVPPQSSGGTLRPEQACFDVQHYDLKLRIDIDTQSIHGILTADARIVSPTSRLTLDLDDHLRVFSVQLLGEGPARTLEFLHTGGAIQILLPAVYPEDSRMSLAVEYGGQPRPAPNPPWEGGFVWQRDSQGNPWVSVACQLEGADLWWPTKDHPSDEPESMDLHITVAKPLVVAANGILAGVQEESDNTVTYHWQIRYPINNYNVTLNIAHYLQIERTYTSVTGQTVPVSFWVLPENHSKALSLVEQIPDHLRFLEETLGPYPFRNEKYGVAETPYLGMEHQTIISYGNQYRNNRYGFDALHFHELAHEWWGNQLSVSDWKDYWIHEGFASYMEALYAESLAGPEALHSYLGTIRGRIRNQHPLAPLESMGTVQKYFVPPDYSRPDGDVNSKGAWVLHTLRYLIGDRAFFESLRRFINPPEESARSSNSCDCRFVETQDFIRTTEQVSGKKLGWFFQVYLRQPRLPILIAKESNAVLELEWQAPEGMDFPMDVPVRLGGRVERVRFSSNEASLELPEGVAWEIDPESWVLRD